MGASRPKRTTVCVPGEKARREKYIEMHLLPMAITSSLGARNCNFHDSQKKGRADVLNILRRSVDCLSCSSTHINALSLPHPLFFAPCTCVGQCRHLYVPLVDCNQARIFSRLCWEHVLSARQPVLGAILLRLPIPIGERDDSKFND